MATRIHQMIIDAIRFHPDLGRLAELQKVAEEVEQELTARDENVRTDLMARLNQMARIIREKKAVPLADRSQ